MYTPEQFYAVDYSRKLLPMRISAFAGAGKTSTQALIAKVQPARRGLYVAFNKSIADDAAGKFPGSVTCKTAHALAFRDVINRGYTAEKMTKAPKSRAYEIKGVKDVFPFHVDTFRTIVAGTLRRFCQSAATAITENLVPRTPGLTDEEQEFAYKWAPEIAANVWEQMTDPDCDLPLGHDGYLKLWALGNPRLFADYILVDEAQDLNMVLIGVVRNQTAQLIAVGDSHQQIYEWRGAKDAMTILPGAECRLTKSFRFGDRIAEAANGVLYAMGERFPLHGHGVIQDAVNPAGPRSIDAVLCRSNAGVIDQALTYLECGRPVCTPGGTGEMRSLVEDAESLQSGGKARNPDMIGFDTWTEVQEYSQTDEGAGLKVFVNLVGKYGCSKLMRVLNQITDKPTPGSVTISTGHKAKGREWSSVKIHDDFHIGEEGNISIAERRLFYVAITRAVNNLYVDPLTLECFSTPDDD